MARVASAGSTGGGGSSSAGGDQAGYCEAWASPAEAESRTCPICLHVPRDAVAHNCGELFCEVCWMRLGTKPKCPSCRSDTDGALPAHRDRREILNLVISCPRECGAVFRLGSKQVHLDEDCMRRPVPCSRCGIEVRADLLEDHTLQDCIHRAIFCPDCSMSTTPHRLPEHRNDECPYRQVLCQLCGESVQFKAMSLHLTAEAGAHFAALIAENTALRCKGQALEREILGLKEAEGKLRKEAFDMMDEMKAQIYSLRQEPVAEGKLKKEALEMMGEMRKEITALRQEQVASKNEICGLRDQVARFEMRFKEESENCYCQVSGCMEESYRNYYCTRHIPMEANTARGRRQPRCER